MKKVSVYDCSVIELQRINSRAGNITPVTNNVNVPFEVKRVFTFMISLVEKTVVRMPTKSFTSF